MLFIDSNALRVSGVRSSGTVYAAYGTLMLLYVITCGTVFYGVMVNVVQ